MSVYLDGIHLASVDERFSPAGGRTVIAEIPEGIDIVTHALGLRLDSFSPEVSVATISDIQEIQLTVAPVALCLGDANYDDLIMFDDIVSVLVNWSATDHSGAGAGDANHDGVVEFDDIVEVLSRWGQLCH